MLEKSAFRLHYFSDRAMLKDEPGTGKINLKKKQLLNLFLEKDVASTIGFSY